MELRKIKISQELSKAREDLLNINFSDSSYPYERIQEWLSQWDPAFRKCLAIALPGMLNIRSSVLTTINGYETEADTELFNEIRPVLVGFIDHTLSIINQDYEVKPVLDEYIKRVKDTKLAEMLKEFNVSKNNSPNLVAIGFRTILALIIQEKAKRLNPQSNTAMRNDIALEKMIDSARNDSVLSSDELRLLDSFKATHKDIYDFVAHRPGANKMIGKDEVETMVDLLNKLLPAIIN